MKTAIEMKLNRISVKHKFSGSMHLALLMLPLLAVWYSAEHKFSGSMQLALLM